MRQVAHLRRRRLVALVVMVVTVAAVATVRSAATGLPPAELVAAEPAVGAHLADSPAAVSLRFSGALDPNGSHLEVFGPDGSPGAVGEPTVTGDTMRLQVRIDTDGTALVAYHGQLREGGEVSGRYRFTVGEDPTGATGPADDVADLAGHSHSPPGAVVAVVIVAVVVVGVGVLVLAVRRPRPLTGPGPGGAGSSSSAIMRGSD
jgi:methionine-rich copper-binding protein CopC